MPNKPMQSTAKNTHKKEKKRVNIFPKRSVCKMSFFFTLRSRLAPRSLSLATQSRITAAANIDFWFFDFFKKSLIFIPMPCNCFFFDWDIESLLFFDDSLLLSAFSAFSACRFCDGSYLLFFIIYFFLKKIIFFGLPIQYNRNNRRFLGSYFWDTDRKHDQNKKKIVVFYLRVSRDSKSRIVVAAVARLNQNENQKQENRKSKKLTNSLIHRQPSMSPTALIFVYFFLKKKWFAKHK